MLKILSFILGALALASFAGALHPLGDSLAVFRPVFLLGAALAVIWTSWPFPIRLGAAILAVLPLLPLVLPEPTPTTAPDLVLYQQNLAVGRDRSLDDDWLASVRASGADVLTLQELSLANRALMQALRTEYPYQHLCPLGEVLGEAVLSRWPIRPGSARCSTRDGFAAIQIDSAKGPLWVVSLHISWPWPHGQAEQLDQILPELESLTGPMLLAGDFNAVAWSHAVKRIARTSQTRRLGPHRASFHLPLIAYPLGIDHVLGQGAASLAMQPGFGSDHRGILAQVSLP